MYWGRCAGRMSASTATAGNFEIVHRDRSPDALKNPPCHISVLVSRRFTVSPHPSDMMGEITQLLLAGDWQSPAV